MEGNFSRVVMESSVGLPGAGVVMEMLLGSGGAVSEEEARITLHGGRVGRRGRVGGRVTKSVGGR